MRLISLTANQPSFEPVIFNRIGLTLIVGRHRSPKFSLQRADLSKTYNGVGKSLTVALINYCLGSNKNEQFDKLLPNWAFTLEFEHARISHRVTRTTGDAKIVFDDEPLSLRKFVEHLESLDIFKPPNEDVKSLTFRSLLTFFLRPKGASYLRYDHPQTKWTDYQSILCQSFLLGLDHHRADQKHKMKLRLDENVELADRYKKDKELKAFYVGEKNAEVELLELGVEIARLEADLHAFRVAEQYAERQQRADQLHHQLSELRNDVILQRNLISDLEMALAVKPDVSPEQVLRVFQEASVLVPELVVKRLEDVQVFHQRLQENRSSRLRQELAETQAQSLMLTARISQFQSELRQRSNSDASRPT